MAEKRKPPAVARNWAVGAAAAVLAGIGGLAASSGWGAMLDDRNAQLQLGSVLLVPLLTVVTGAGLLRTEVWRRFGAGLLGGGATVFAVYFVFLLWIVSNVGLS